MLDLVSLDIETTGLDPSGNRVRAIGFAYDDAVESLVSSDEKGLLVAVERFVQELSPTSMLITWNGEEFDLPFLAARFAKKRLPTRLVLRALQETGKYGNPLFAAEWASHDHVDIAPFFRETAAKLGVPWSLKPVAKAVLGSSPVEVDRRGTIIARLDESSLRSYVESDARITLALARTVDPRLLQPRSLPAVG